MDWVTLELAKKLFIEYLRPLLRTRVAALIMVCVGSALANPGLVLGFPAAAWGSPHWTATGATLLLVFVYFEEITPFAVRVRYQWKISKWAGLARVFPVAPYPDLAQGHPHADDPDAVRNAADGAMKDLLSRDLSSVQLLLVSGWRMIGHGALPGTLLKPLKGRAKIGQIEVLLLNPYGDVARKRADQLGLTWPQYQSGVQAVLHTLKMLRDETGRSIDVYFYDEEPIWQMVVTRPEIWVFCAATDIPAERSPIYTLRTDAEYGLAFGFAAVWKRRREMAILQDLDSVTAPDRKELRNLDTARATENGR